MHLAKGLEFRAVAVMACDDEIIPLQERIATVGDDADLQEVYDTERHLLYVACTRKRSPARDQHGTGVGIPGRSAHVIPLCVRCAATTPASISSNRYLKLGERTLQAACPEAVRRLVYYHLHRGNAMTQAAARAPDGAAPFEIRSSGITDRGKVRSGNEDHFLIGELARTLWVHQTSLPQPSTQYGRNRGHIFLVADGMGGHQAGAVASALSVRTIETFVLHVLHRFSNLQAGDEQGVIKDLQQALQFADARLFQEAAGHPEFAGMGTTLTMALTSGARLFVIHAGDSRCYRLRAGTLQQLTIDHTMAEEMARQGIIEREAVRHHQWRHVVTNALGGITAGVRADVSTVDLQAQDTVLLCTDGLTDMLSDDRIAAVLMADTEPAVACERLVAEANAQGGKDNITAIIARVEAA